MRGAASGVFLLASWRVGFSLFLWIATVFLFFLIFRCLKSLVVAIKDQGLAVLALEPGTPHRRHCGLYTVEGRGGRDRPGWRAASHTEPELYLPPNTPAPPSPPPYSSLAPARPEEPPPTYASLYPAKQHYLPPV